MTNADNAARVLELLEVEADGVILAGENLANALEKAASEMGLGHSDIEFLLNRLYVHINNER